MAETTPCPICGKPGQAHPRLRPFCSQRCADVDLGRWFKGHYRIPGPPTEEDEGTLDPQHIVR